MTALAVAAHRPPITRRIALSGSQTWPVKWRGAIWRDLDGQLARLAPGDTFYLRHGNARRGADYAAHLWFEDRKGGPHGVIMVEERVDADWMGSCVEEPYTDVRGQMVRACPPGHRKPVKGSDKTKCPSAGHRRNPDVVAHPDYPVNLFLAYCLDDSSGTMGTVGHAKRYRVNYSLHAAYSPRPEAAAPERDDPDPGGGEG